VHPRHSRVNFLFPSNVPPFSRGTSSRFRDSFFFPPGSPHLRFWVFVSQASTAWFAIRRNAHFSPLSSTPFRLRISRLPGHVHTGQLCSLGYLPGISFFSFAHDFPLEGDVPESWAFSQRLFSNRRHGRLDPLRLPGATTAWRSCYPELLSVLMLAISPPVFPTTSLTDMTPP